MVNALCVCDDYFSQSAFERACTQPQPYRLTHTRIHTKHIVVIAISLMRGECVAALAQHRQQYGHTQLDFLCAVWISDYSTSSHAKCHLFFVTHIVVVSLFSLLLLLHSCAYVDISQRPVWQTRQVVYSLSLLRLGFIVFNVLKSLLIYGAQVVCCCFTHTHTHS